MRAVWMIIGLLLILKLSACAPALIGAGAAGGYKVGTDERSMGTMWDDASISARVKEALVKSEAVHAYDIDVDTLEGVVVLNGVVDTEAEARVAESIAGRVQGVKRVKNFIQVGRESAGQVLDDSVIFSRIKGKLVGEPGIRSLNIDVDVHRGVVTLNGIVKDKYQRNRVVALAQETPGVVRVQDNLTLRNP